MLKIRLTRTGKTHNPSYRIVVAEHSAPIQGKFIEILGYYLPTRHPKVLEVNKERTDYWMSKGAQPTDTVHNLLVDKGILTTKRDIKYSKVIESTESKPAEKTEEKTETASEPAEEQVQEEVTETQEETPAEPATETPDEDHAA